MPQFLNPSIKMRTNKSRKTLTLNALFLIMTIGAFAQEVKYLSLEEALSIASKNNTSIKLSNKDRDIAKALYHQTAATFLPNVSITNTSSVTNNPLNNFGFKLLQETTVAADFNPALLNNPTKIKNFNTKIELIQPLLNFDAFEQRKALKAQIDASNSSLERSKEGVDFKVKTSYLQLQLAYKSVDVLQQSLHTALANKILADNLFKQGLIQKSDVLNVDVNVSEVQNRLQLAQSFIANTSNDLAYLLNSEEQTILKPKDSLELALNDDLITKNLNTNRSDFLAYQSQLKSQEHLVNASKYKFLPRANAFSNYEWNTSNFLGMKANNYFIGLQLRWDVFNGGQNLNKISQEKATLDKATLNYNDYLAQGKIELAKAKRQLNDAKSNLNRTEIAVIQSQEVLRITTNRFKQGLEKTTDLLNAETQFQTKQLEYYQAVFNYNLNTNYLIFLLK